MSKKGLSKHHRWPVPVQTAQAPYGAMLINPSNIPRSLIFLVPRMPQKLKSAFCLQKNLVRIIWSSDAYNSDNDSTGLVFNGLISIT